MITTEFTDSQGVVIVYDVYSVPTPRAVVQIMHGQGSVLKFDKIEEDITDRDLMS